MNMTNRDKSWELRNSLWIIWSFTWVLNYVGFFWIGGRAGKRKWIISGAIYLLIFVFALYFVNSEIAPFDSISIVLFISSWPAGIIHSFLSRKEYLLRREAVEDLQIETRDLYRDEIRKNYFEVNPSKKSTQPNLQQYSLHEPVRSQKLDLNTCSEQQLISLPGVGIVLAKKAIELRELDPFISTEDFSQRLGLKPHFAAQVDNMTFVLPQDTQILQPPELQPSLAPSDSNQPAMPSKSGRIIDF